MRKLFSQTIEKEVLQPMAKCQFCDKGLSFGIKVSHSHRRSNRTWKPNVKRVKAIVDGKPQARLRMHPLPPQRQGHPRCVNCNDCTEQGSPDWASLFRIFGH